MSEESPKTGRPSAYSTEVASAILARLCAGESLRAICRDDDMPARSTVHLWIVEDREGFSDHYARAMQARAILWADEILDIADDGSNDTYVDDRGREKTDFDNVQRSRLRVDTRKWMLSKMLPKLYGDRVAHELTGPDGGPIQVQELTDEALVQRAAQLRNRLAAVMPSVNGNGSNGKH